MPRNRFLPRLSTRHEEGGDCELTPLTAIDPRPQSLATSNPGSRFSNESVGRPSGRVREKTDKKRRCTIIWLLILNLIGIASTILLILVLIEFNNMRKSYSVDRIVANYYIESCASGFCSSNGTAPTIGPEYQTWVPKF
jgi:hypothetical protein